MASDRAQLRGVLLVEDRRTERFFRELLVHLGFDKRKFIFKTAPSGKGDAGAWVRAQYPTEVNVLRQKRHQRLCLVAVRDGDSAGMASKKADPDSACPRQGNERIATPVPTWSIETWLLALLGDILRADQVETFDTLSGCHELASWRFTLAAKGLFTTLWDATSLSRGDSR